MAQIEKFYRDVQVKRRETSGSHGVTLDVDTIPDLTAKLRGYQHRGVEWMLAKEQRNAEAEKEEVNGPHPLHLLWKELPTVEHGLPCAVYFNVHSGK